MNISAEKLETIFTRLYKVIETDDDLTAAIDELEKDLQDNGFFEFEGVEDLVEYCIARLKGFASEYEEKKNNPEADEEIIDQILKDILIYSSYIITLLEDLEESGEITVV